MSSMVSLPSDSRPAQSSSGIPLSKGGLSDQWNITSSGERRTFGEIASRFGQRFCKDTLRAAHHLELIL